MIWPNNILVIYHETKPGTPCTDGIAAAWVVNEAAKRGLPGLLFPLYTDWGGWSLRFCGRCYTEPLPEDTIEWANFIVIVDFSFSSEELQQLTQKDKRLLVIDHHASAIRKLEGAALSSSCKLVLDLKKSGAWLAWECLIRGEAPPGFIRYISDRDLWKFELPESKAVTTEIGFGGLTFERFDELAQMDAAALQAELGPKGLVRQVELNKICERIASAAKPERVGVRNIPIIRNVAKWAAKNHHVWLRDFISWLAGYTVPVARLAADGSEDWARSDVGNLLCSWALVNRPIGFSSLPFAACRFADGSMSLRSKDQLMDVSKVCERMGGGGHRNAAGYGGQSLEKLRAAVVAANDGRSWWTYD